MGQTYRALRKVERAAQHAPVTKLHRDRHAVDAIHLRFDDGDEWTQVVADYLD